MFPPLAPPFWRAPHRAIHSASKGQARAEPSARPPQSAMRSSTRYGILAYAISPCRSGLKPSGAHCATRARGEWGRGRRAMNDNPSDIGKRIADELAACGVRLVASLPDNWLTGVIGAVDRDERFVHIPVNREESAIGLCSGAYMGAMGSATLMGASGFMTVIYAITKINYTYEIPLFLMLTLRGGLGDHHKHHVSNSLYLRPVLDAIDLPYQVVDDAKDIGLISRAYRHTRTFCRPFAVLFTRDLLRGQGGLAGHGGHG